MGARVIGEGEFPHNPLTCDLRELTAPLSALCITRRAYTLSGRELSYDEQRRLDWNIRSANYINRRRGTRGGVL